MILSARRGKALHGTAAIPGDKSCSHRALILGAMAAGDTFIDGLGDGADIASTIDALAAFGVTVRVAGAGQWAVTGGPWRSPSRPVDCSNSGTTARLLIGAVAGMDGVCATFIGDPSLSRRPMRRLTEPLRRMGARIDGGDTLPISIEGVRPGGIVHRNLPASAQVKTALLLAGLGGTAPIRIEEPTPSRDHGEIMLGEFGIEAGISDDGAARIVTLGPARRPEATRIGIGADPSSAAFPLVAALLVEGSEVTVKRMLVNPTRTGLYEVLERMGADITLSNEQRVSGEIWADVTLRGGWVEPAHVGAAEIAAMIDEVPVLAMVCASADGESVIEGLDELRHKESDRLGALVAGLTAVGVAAAVDGDALRIFGRGRVRGGRVSSQGDHRIAMAFLTLGLASRDGIEIDDGTMIVTSFPDFVGIMQRLGADIG